MAKATITVRIDREVYAAIKAAARAGEYESPNSVLRLLLGLDGARRGCMCTVEAMEKAAARDERGSTKHLNAWDRHYNACGCVNGTCEGC